jgi:hypothetical protein
MRHVEIGVVAPMGSMGVLAYTIVVPFLLDCMGLRFAMLRFA